MAVIDPMENFAVVEVSTGYDASATTIALSSGERAKIPDIADGASNGVWYNATDYPDVFSDPNREIVRRTGDSSTDSIVVTRAQEGTTAQTHNEAGKTYKIIFGLTKKSIDDINAALIYATDTDSGLIELATQAEVDAGTDTFRAVTPDTLQGNVGEEVSQADAEAGTLVNVRRWSPVRVFSAVKGWFDQSDGWREPTGVIPTFSSTSGGVDTISFASVDLTGDIQVGEWCKCSSSAGSDLIYKVKSISYSTNTTVELVGETSVSGTISAISFSKLEAPQGATPWESLFLVVATKTGQSIANTSVTTAQLVEVDDPNSDFSSYTWTIPVSGYYSIGAYTRWAGGIAGKRYSHNISGPSSIVVWNERYPATGGNESNGMTSVEYIERGTQIYLSLYHSHGSTYSHASSVFTLWGNWIGV